MKTLSYILAGLVLFVSCAKEPGNIQDATSVPLNVTIMTKAGGGSDDDGGAPAQDIRSVRIVVFKDFGGAAANDQIVLNEYYAFGFGVDDRTDGRYTVTVKPTLELDVNTNKYYVYAVLNEEDFVLTDASSTSVTKAMESVSSRGDMTAWLNIKAKYSAGGLTSTPYCLMSACKKVDFSTIGKDNPVDVHFGFDANDNDMGGAVDRTMAQITVESIRSAESTTTDGVMALLPKVFVLDVQLVNVPNGIAWGVGDDGTPIAGNTTGGTVSLPIGEATEDIDGTNKYYKRLWEGNVYKQVDVNVDCEQRMTVNYYRTKTTATAANNEKDKFAWGFYDPTAATPITKYVYAGTTPLPSGAPTKPYGFPTLNAAGKNYEYWVWQVDNKHPENSKNVQKKKGKNDQDYTDAYTDYYANLPHDPATGEAVIATEAAAYNTYYTTNKTAVDTYYAELPGLLASAKAGLGTIDNKYDAANDKKSVYDLVSTQLPAIFAKETYYSTNKYTIASVKSSQPDTYVSYCTEERWTVKLGDSYYVPENLSSSFDNTSTTCIKVKIAFANPDINASGVSASELPVPENVRNEGNTATYRYWFDNYYYATAADYSNGILTKQELPTSGANSTPTGSFELTQTGNEPKLKITKYKADGTFDLVENKNFNVVDLFKQNGRVVDADDETVPADSTTNNRFVAYIPAENFWRTGTGLTGTVIVDNDQEGATFSWNIPITDNSATTDFKEVKEFYIPVNNAEFDSDGDNAKDYGIRRNTKYTVKLVVGENTYDSFTKASGPASAPTGVAGLSVTAEVTAEKLNEDED